MTKLVRTVASGVLAVALGSFGNPAAAGTITANPTPSGPGLGSVIGVVISTPQANNDNTTNASGNTIVIEQKAFGSVNPIDIVFTVSNSGGATEYFVSETVTNNTGSTWLDFHVQLGFGTGAGFLESSLEDTLDFDTPGRDPAASSSVFDPLDNTTHLANSLSWLGGQVLPGNSVTFQFSIDIPDSSFCAETSPSCPIVGENEGYLFALRQFPTAGPPVGIPGPTPVLIVALGSLAIAKWRRRG